VVLKAKNGIAANKYYRLQTLGTSDMPGENYQISMMQIKIPTKNSSGYKW
jgi:hypothetical protein